MGKPPTQSWGNKLVFNEEPSAGSLTAIILTYNEAAHIQECISSLLWADHILVYDSHSNDNTIDLGREMGAEIGLSVFANYAQQRNAALDSLTGRLEMGRDWVFFVDADERGTPALGAEIRQVMNDRPETGWHVPRLNYIFGKLTKGAGWYPDYQLRLFRYGRVHYERPVHEIAVVDGEIGYLENPLIHYNYRDPAQFHEKQRRYCEYDATILKQKGVQPRPYTYVTMPLRQFWWRFITLNGYRDGWHGLRLSAYMAYYEWMKIKALGSKSFPIV